MARAATVQSSGRPLKVLKQSANNVCSGDVIPGRCDVLANKATFLFFAKYENRTMKLFAVLLFRRSAHIPFHWFPCKSVNHVKEYIKATNTFIYSLSLLPRFR